MTRVLLSNIEEGLSSEEVNAFLARYGFPPPSASEPVPGDGSQPALMLSFDGCTPEALHMLRERIHGLYWHHRKLSVEILMEGFS